MLKSTPLEKRKAAWLYAQFTVAKSTSLKKFFVGLTPIRDSDIRSEHVTKVADRSEEHTSELQSRQYLVCRLLLEKKKQSKGAIPLSIYLPPLTRLMVRP